MDVTELFFFGGIAEKAADLSDTRYQGTGILKLIPGIRQEYFVFNTIDHLNAAEIYLPIYIDVFNINIIYK